MDRRVRKTREALLSAVIEIASARGWGAASINEICDKADIARSTFYLHFADKAALTDFALARLEETIRGAESNDSLVTTGVFTFLRPLVRLAVDPVHAFLFITDVNAPEHHEVSDQFRLMIERLVEHEVSQTGDKFQLDWAHQSFIAGGIHSLIQSCHNRQTDTETSDIAEDLVTQIAPILKHNIMWQARG